MLIDKSVKWWSSETAETASRQAGRHIYIYKVRIWCQLWSLVSSAPAVGISFPNLLLSLCVYHHFPKAERVCDWQQKNNWWPCIRKKLTEIRGLPKKTWKMIKKSISLLFTVHLGRQQGTSTGLNPLHPEAGLSHFLFGWLFVPS